MNEREWKSLQDELKQLGPDREDAPQDAYRFKQRVLEEYERRTRFHWRGRWSRRAAMALKVAAAVCLAFFVAPLFTTEGGTDKGKQAALQGVAADELENLTARGAVNQFFNLILLGRQQEASALLAADLRREEFPVSEKKGQHITGFSLYNMSVGSMKMLYGVDLTWSTGGDHAEMTNYFLRMKQQGDRWEIESVEQKDVRALDGAGGTTLTHTARIGVREEADSIRRSSLPEAGGWTSFVYDATKQGGYFVLAGERPVLYQWEAGRDAQKLATLPKGRVNAEFVSDEGIVAVNFAPQDLPGSGQALFYDGTTGAQLDMSWLDDHLNLLGLYDVEVLHALPGNRFRVRIGTGTYILDLAKSKIELDSFQPAALSQVKHDLRLPVAPAGGLAVTDELPADAAVPEGQQIDPQQEVGLYVINGSVATFSFGLQDLKLQVRSDPGRVQVLAMPLAALQPYAGQSIAVKCYGEDGKLLESRTLKIPEGGR